MAISLKDIKNPRKDKREVSQDQKEKVLRPWETYDSLGLQTRTISAQEAVRQARITVQKNNEMVENLKKNSYKPKEQDDSRLEVNRQPKRFFLSIINFFRGNFL